MAKSRYKKPRLIFSLPNDPALFTLQPGQYHRVLSDSGNRSYPANSFNPYKNYSFDPDGTLRDPENNICAGTRFAPVLDANGKIVSTLYLASTDRAAYAEILVRGKSFRPITFQVVSTLERVTLELTTPLNLLNLVPPFIDDGNTNDFGISEKDLLSSPERYYKETCRFASEAHAKYDHIQGLHWRSRQEDNNSVVVLFGDRLDANWLKEVNNFAAGSVEEMRIWAPDAARYNAVLDDDMVKYMRAVFPDFHRYPNW